MSTIDFDKLFEGEICFCGSGKEYSDCHKVRKYNNPNEILHDQTKFMHRRRPCPVWESHSPCGEKTIASHSQQRRGALKTITEKGHVIGFSTGPNARTSFEDSIELVPVSAKKASTFPGLCAKHDNQIFSEIEKLPLNPNYKTAIQLAKRCALYEAIVHSDGALFSQWLQVVPEFEFPMDMEINHAEIENMSHYAKYNWNLLRKISKIELKSSPTKFRYFSTLISSSLPFSATGCFCIENDLFGRKLQRFGDMNNHFAYAQISILPQENGISLFSISSTEDRNKKVSSDFISSFRDYRGADFGNALLRTALNYTENIYFRPSWICALSQSERMEIISRFDDSRVFSIGSEKPSNSLSKPLTIEISGQRINSSTNVPRRKHP